MSFSISAYFCLRLFIFASSLLKLVLLELALDLGVYVFQLDFLAAVYSGKARLDVKSGVYSGKVQQRLVLLFS